MGHAALVAFVALGCSGSQSKEPGPDAGGGDGTMQGSASGSSGVSAKPDPDVMLGAACDDDEECPPTHYCSAAHVCRPLGTCFEDADCHAPDRCGAGSSTCLTTGACKQSQDCPDGQICAEGRCAIGGTCGQSEFELSQVPANVLILLDRGAAMSFGVDPQAPSRWNQAKEAIRTVTTSYDEQIRFGLATYSSCLPEGCSAGRVIVPVAEHNAAAINDFLAGTVDRGSNDGQARDAQGKLQYLCEPEGLGRPEMNTARSLLSVASDPALRDATRENAILLVSNGVESEQCQDECDGPCAASMLLTRDPPVRTFAINMDVLVNNMNAIAEAGGTGASIPGLSPSELSAAFGGIAASVSSCDYQLSSTPRDPSQLFVFFDDEPEQIPREGADGWTFAVDANRVTFHGASCERIASGRVSDIDVVYGCPQPVPVK